MLSRLLGLSAPAEAVKGETQAPAAVQPAAPEVKEEAQAPAKSKNQERSERIREALKAQQDEMDLKAKAKQAEEAKERAEKKKRLEEMNKAQEEFVNRSKAEKQAKADDRVKHHAAEEARLREILKAQQDEAAKIKSSLPESKADPKPKSAAEQAKAEKAAKILANYKADKAKHNVNPVNKTALKIGKDTVPSSYSMFSGKQGEFQRSRKEEQQVHQLRISKSY